MSPELRDYLVVGAILFVLGGVGFLVRRNLIVLFLSAEMMLQGVALNLIAFGRHHGNYQGQSFAAFVLAVAACEAAIALPLILALYQRRRTLDIGVWHELRETGEERMEELPPVVEEPPPFPTLTPAGREPALSESEAGGA